MQQLLQITTSFVMRCYKSRENKKEKKALELSRTQIWKTSSFPFFRNIIKVAQQSWRTQLERVLDMKANREKMKNLENKNIKRKEGKIRHKYLHHKGRKEILYHVNMKMFKRSPIANKSPFRSFFFFLGVNKKCRWTALTEWIQTSFYDHRFVYLLKKMI